MRLFSSLRLPRATEQASWLWPLLLLSLLGAASPGMAKLSQAEQVSESLMTQQERQALDLTDYRVRDTDASYFDVKARQRLLERTDNSLLLQITDKLSTGFSCQGFLNLPPITTSLRIPSFYPRPEAWRLASEPLFKFEDSVSQLAGAYVATGSSYYADCLGRFLDQWAQANALINFHYDPNDPQAWFSTESMIFAAAMAYSVVRPELADQPERRKRINDWLHRLANRHAYVPDQSTSSCCNNHFYRRALYASMVGVLTEDDKLFRYGVSAVYSALSEMDDRGALPREAARGRRATHYQNYALLYLITNMQVIARQGYPIFELDIEGHTVHDGVDFLVRAIKKPEILGEDAPLEQYYGFLKDEQYFSWMEIYLHHHADPRLTEFLSAERPIYNRSAGGYTTLFFMNPSAQQHVEPTPDAKEKQQLTVFDKEVDQS